MYVSCQNPSQVGNDKMNEKKQRKQRYAHICDLVRDGKEVIKLVRGHRKGSEDPLKNMTLLGQLQAK